MTLPWAARDWPPPRPNASGPLVLSDDPADHGLSAAEVACIEAAYVIRRRAVQAELEQTPTTERTPLWRGLSWPTDREEQLRAVFIGVPLLLLLAVGSVLLKPITRLADWRKEAQRKAKLRAELVALERPPMLHSLPDKTLLGLWESYGYEEHRFPEAVEVELVSTWIDRLYGPEVTDALHLGERLEAVTRRRARLRDPSSQIVCVLYIPRLEQVLKDLSRELPPYSWLDTGGDQARPQRVH